ncbi:hypothetical protein AGLY_008517 [Aphis glycines]|uniref:Uncharacterized protein n=1 Tax=Aphis glycines TaxID=307491 RepID=A0A6G0TL34_APHGL|nr:hypothetical protein AGLY_008517 [Aphis glycines]
MIEGIIRNEKLPEYSMRFCGYDMSYKSSTKTLNLVALNGMVTIEKERFIINTQVQDYIKLLSNRYISNLCVPFGSLYNFITSWHRGLPARPNTCIFYLRYTNSPSSAGKLRNLFPDKSRYCKLTSMDISGEPLVSKSLLYKNQFNLLPATFITKSNCLCKCLTGVLTINATSRKGSGYGPMIMTNIQKNHSRHRVQKIHKAKIHHTLNTMSSSNIAKFVEFSVHTEVPNFRIDFNKIKSLDTEISLYKFVIEK